METAKIEKAIVETPEKLERMSQAEKVKWFYRWRANMDNRRDAKKAEIRRTLRADTAAQRERDRLKAKIRDMCTR